MARVKPKGRPRLGGRGCHVQQYKLQDESVASSYQSKRVQVLRWRRGQSNLEEAASAHKEEHNKIRELQLSASCIASSSLIAQLEMMSLLEGPPVDESSDFDSSEVIVEEATV
ncbi:hypothetical protein C6341_g18746 [Phytophthora cactorum]|nr:hypothetical protein C6341_g18746 [Phytophthora cactorum]